VEKDYIALSKVFWETMQYIQIKPFKDKPKLGGT